ncbi:Nuclear aminoacylation-dependent tRNA export pathway component [Coniosporium apollinis]|uniref:Nuclear aminoacylation-dependent tRNA export pathway component n=2 Tax=Coniosporium TaxID=2810619 RepID=A0ABQ9NWZ7_9PEZI|nr:Nuclear aminoacylation-dependent tRNA export pathway component [Cladosporium sp. JES 115]KAJ9665123.1 Nuclear aminoacylation-dependent tRNA export pathway component [Coniosporium apollinis]
MQKTIKFINDEAASVHGSIRTSSIFCSESGEWKLGGFDVLSSVKEDDAIIYSAGSLVPDSGRYAPPEVANGGWEVIKRHPLTAPDAYAFGILIFETFNGGFRGSDQVGLTQNIPPSMHQSYKRLVTATPKTRLSVGQFYDQGHRQKGFFETPLIQLTEGIENMGLKTESEKEEFLSQLEDVSEDFPEDFFKMKVLPELLKSVEFGGGGPKVFGIVMKISSKLSDEEYEASITPVIVRLFMMPDRAIRVYLLDNLPLMIDHLPQKIVNDKIFPQMVTGFTDVAPVVREQTVKAVLTVVNKLSDRTVNGELLRYLAKTANDEQPGIRTNTTICLGKIARNLGANTRTKVLTAAFARSLRDPFVHARNAALQALAATADIFTEDDCATKLLPAISPSLVDKEKIVRDQANKTLDIYITRIRKYSQTLPETALPPPTAANASTAATPRMGTPANDVPSGWAGWAISSFTNKLSAASGQMTTGANGAAQSEKRSQSLPPAAETARPTSSTNTASPIYRQTLTKPSTTTNPFAAPSSTPSVTSADDLAEAEDFGAAWGDEPAEEEPNPWADSTLSSKPSTTTTFVDDGEPDFAGWLSAQHSAKQGAGKKPLPKGLAKTAATTVAGRPAVSSRANTTGHVGPGAGAKKMAAAHVKGKVVAPVKKVETKKEDVKNDDDEGWGDAWE